MISACESALFLKDLPNVGNTLRMLYHRLTHEPYPANELRITLQDMGLLKS